MPIGQHWKLDKIGQNWNENWTKLKKLTNGMVKKEWNRSMLALKKGEQIQFTQLLGLVLSNKILKCICWETGKAIKQKGG